MNMKMKRGLAVLLSCTMLLSGIVSVKASAEDSIKEGTDELTEAWQTGEADMMEAGDRVGKIIEGMSLEEKVGQMIMTQFRTWNENPEDEQSDNVPVTELNDEIREAIARDRFGGIILFAENCPENEQTRALIEQMQEANLAGDCEDPIPLLIAVDQEGGAVARLGQGTRWIGNMALTATGDPENAKIAAACIGGELSALGFNTDFAPVIDVNNNPANPVIGVRSFSDDPDTVATYGISYLDGLGETGMISSLKHFPGHGDVETDSHIGFPVVDKSYDELKACELIPFQEAIKAGAEMVMTAHIQYPQIETYTYVSLSTGEDVYLPATLSNRILEGILRKDLGFEGVIVSDALNMAAIADHFDRKDVAVKAIEAGINLFLIPVQVGDAETLTEQEDFMAYICEQVRSGVISESRIDDSVRRILTMKEEHGLLDIPEIEDMDETAEAVQRVGSEENHALEWELMSKAVTLLKNEGDILPIEAKPGEKILFLYSAQSRIATAEFARRRLEEEELIPEDVVFDAMAFDAENADACVQAAKEADHVIGVTSTVGTDALDPSTESGAVYAVLDQVIDAVHEDGNPFILISSNLPYDTARFQAADAILVTYGSTPMAELPEGKTTYSPNIPAAICGIFGEYEFSGKLPVNIPKLDEEGHFTDKILYSRN